MTCSLQIHEKLSFVNDSSNSRKKYSIQHIADSISDNQTYIPKRSGEMETTLSNIDKIGEVMGWKPEVDVIDWIETNA